MDHYLLTERIVDDHTGEVLGQAGEQDPPRLMEYLGHYPDSAERPAWLTAALQTCWQSSEPFRA